jgi:tRNA(Arg) A34 adenosine deaminase TadA
MTTLTDLELHSRFLSEAIDEALSGVRAFHGGPFGALVVRDGAILGRGHNRVTSQLDPTAHGEVVAIRAACSAERDFALRGATLYTSCEPCPLCLAAAYWARIERVYYAAARSDAAAVGFDDERLHAALAPSGGVTALPLEQVPHARAGEPFAAWRALGARVPY